MAAQKLHFRKPWVWFELVPKILFPYLLCLHMLHFKYYNYVWFSKILEKETIIKEKIEIKKEV